MPEPITLDLSFSATVDATDPARRTIAGTVVPFGVFGNTSVGPAAFVAGAFADLDASSVVLVREHDEASPLGRATRLDADGDRLEGTFRIAGTSAGNDALVEAAEQLRAGFSVGARALEYEHDDEGRLIVTAAELRHVGLVVRPAYETAQVTNVAANRHDQERPAMPENTDATVDANATADEQLDTRITAAVTAALDARAEADRKIDANRPPEPRTPYVEVNEPDITAGQYARAVVLAANGDAEADQLIRAALTQVGTTGHTGVIPTPLLNEMIDTARTGRPTVDSLTRRPLPAAGMQFELPRWVTKPTTAVTAESTEISSTATVIDELPVDVVKIAGGNRVSVELIERSSPAYLEELIEALTQDFRDKSNAYAFAQINPGRALADDAHSVGATTVEQYAQGIADAYDRSKKLPDRSLAGLNGWTGLQAETDTGGRPLFSAYNPSNNPGAVRNSLTGQVMGTTLALETDAGVDDVLVFPSAAANYYEQPGAPITVRMMQVSTLEWEVAVYGFLAVANKHPGAFRWLTDTEPAA